jgi:hypothetical protein
MRWIPMAWMALALGALTWCGCPAEDPQGPADDDSASDDDTGGSDDDTGDDDTTVDPCAGHCDNGVQDCGEEDIDCGGDCSSCAPELRWGEDAEGKHPAVIAWGTRVMVLFGRADRTTPIQYSCFEDGTWGALADVTTSNSWRPNPAADSDGTVHLAYNTYDGPGEQAVYYTAFTGDCATGTWSEPEYVSSGISETDNSTEPCIDLDTSEDVWVGWSHSLGAANGTTLPCSDTGDCDDALGAGAFYCSTDICRPYYEILVRRRHEGQWDDATVVSAGTIAYFSHVALDVVDDGTAFATFMKGNDGVAIWYSQFNGTSWGAPANTSLGLQFSEVVVHGGYGHVLSNSSAGYRRKDLGGDWEDVVSLGSADMDFPDMVIDGHGTAHAVWPDSHQIQYRIGDADSGTWPDPAVQISTNASSSHPWVDVDDAGYAHIVWAGGDDDGPVWYLKTRYEDL